MNAVILSRDSNDKQTLDKRRLEMQVFLNDEGVPGGGGENKSHL